jgi:phosphoglycolate phosphatase-like HAD superfamily hydrolase
LVLCWDLDGTLLTTARAGVFALEAAAQDVLGRSVDLSSMRTAGLTDTQIARTILMSSGASPTPELVVRFLERYEELLPERLSWRTGRVLPGVREILDAAAGRRDILSMLLTGNTRAGARAKLTHYGLDRYFEHGAFSDGEPDRSAIARKAAAVAAQRIGAESPTHIFVIGDTPHDIQCATVIGARAIAVATGTYALDELTSHGPWWALEHLPEPATFFARLDNAHGAL